MRRFRREAASRGFTLIEILLSVALTLAVMTFVVKIFATISRSINDSRTGLEMSSRVRGTVARLREDLRCATADMTPPARPDDGKGYLEIIEGLIGPATPPQLASLNLDQLDASGNPTPDSSVLDNDDVLALTVRTRGEPFVGRTFVKTAAMGPYGDALGQFDVYTRTAESELAEVIWFVRGTTLYRRVLLVLPNHDVDLRTSGVHPLVGLDFFSDGSANSFGFYGDYFQMTKGETDHRSKGFFNNFDLSVRLEGYDPANLNNKTTWRLVPNTLADLAKRENRFAHQPANSWPATNADWASAFPFNPYSGKDTSGNYVPTDWWRLGMPTLRECSHVEWVPGGPLWFAVLNTSSTPPPVFDAWTQPHPFKADSNTPSGVDYQDAATGTLTKRGTPASDPPAFLGPRVAEDVILTNVIGFDVKVWDATAPLILSGTTLLSPGDPGYLTAVDANTTMPGGVRTLAPAAIAGRGGYVDMGYGLRTDGTVWPISNFSGPGTPKSKLSRVYDTWSIHYEHDGLDQDPTPPLTLGVGVDGGVDQGTNGFDDNEDTNGDGFPENNTKDGVVDDLGEWEAPPPYGTPLRGVQITIRVFEPDSGQIRTVTIVQDFLPE